MCWLLCDSIYQGDKALEAMRGGLCYAIAIFDLELPGIDGDALMAQSKRMHPDVPVISLTGYAHYVPAASNAHFRKPVDPYALEQKVDSLLRPKAVCSYAQFS